MMRLVPKLRMSGRTESPARPYSQSGSALLRSAIEPGGSGPYVEAVREWIERATPRPAPRQQLRLVR